MRHNSNVKIAGVVLAGGLGRRMGGVRKAETILAGRELLSWIVERFAPQVDCLLLSVAVDEASWQGWGLPVLCDTAPPPHALGPAAGIVRAMAWLCERTENYCGLVSVPCDTPFLPLDLVAQLTAHSHGGTRATVARSSGRTHPIVGFWPLGAQERLIEGLIEAGERRLSGLSERLGAVAVSFSTDPIDPFFNINRPEDLVLAQAMARGEK